MPEQPSIWEQGRQYPDLWAAPSGAPVDASPPPGAGAPLGHDSHEQPAQVHHERRHRWTLPRFPTGFWLSLIAVLLIGFVLVHPGRGSRPVFVPQTVLSDDVAEAAEPVVPPTPSPSMVAELDAPLPTIPPPVEPTTVPPAVTETATSLAPEVTEPSAVTTVPPAPVANSEPPATPPATEPSVAPPPTATTVPVVPVVPIVPTTVPEAPPPATTTQPPPPPSTAPTPASGPRVEIIGRVGPCRFGNRCLIAGFRIHDFDVQPTGYVCEFADGSRFLFRMGGNGADYACATGTPGDSITIEVSGVRSAPFSAT